MTFNTLPGWFTCGAVLGIGLYLGRGTLRGPVSNLALRIASVRASVGEGRLRAAGRAALALWFAYWAVDALGTLARQGAPFGQDIRIYYRATQLWLSGGDPWTASIRVGSSTFSYAGSPATTIILAPSALLSEGQFAAFWICLTALCALLIVRRLGLPIWWLLFAPTLEAVWSGNPQVVVLALLLAGSGRLGAIADATAVALKPYGWVPLLGERSIRRVLGAAAFTVMTFAVAPGLWVSYLRQFQAVSARIAVESSKGFSAFYYPLLLVPVALAILLMWRRDRRVALWLAVPALWPASEFHYSTLAMPVMSPILAVLLVIRVQQLPPVAILVDVAWRLGGSRLRAGLSDWLRQPDRPDG